MAGSLADFKYIADDGSAWLVRIDKSNALATGTGFVPLTQADLGLKYLPRNLELRYVNCRHPTRPINRTIYCQSTSAPIWLGTTKTISLRDYQDGSVQAFNVGKRVAEKEKYRVNLTDTYQNDTP
ncbi:hypothetical protein [Pseudanabaena sp. 'Roaring Creek']|uniref:hypothetical protein n=1 Tax=Pseudanabaena sp. 'Roaring Creek' TaxID=1681830 RepID=UPI0006D78CD6|nr:hypothetical protein [Pseudanabaena sp. 'Roaring Creek']